ncbi:unnamed protein product [Prorocentrum cordatum]|uniref:Uncharacterized protein n=1 Tax=Prorocentrum cordatum TaxID=2364126 RepID=A0ABN9S6U9_9DINO|nr:unnamed protein product [Polarella glacialis]
MAIFSDVLAYQLQVAQDKLIDLRSVLWDASLRASLLPRAPEGAEEGAAAAAAAEDPHAEADRSDAEAPAAVQQDDSLHRPLPPWNHLSAAWERAGGSAQALLGSLLGFVAAGLLGRRGRAREAAEARAEICHLLEVHAIEVEHREKDAQKASRCLAEYQARVEQIMAEHADATKNQESAHELAIRRGNHHELAARRAHEECEEQALQTELAARQCERLTAELGRCRQDATRRPCSARRARIGRRQTSWRRRRRPPR